jgi:5-methylcytosine-specific restriction enzyme A
MQYIHYHLIKNSSKIKGEYMRDKIGFIYWLDQNTSLSKTSKMRYAREVENISENFNVQLYGATKIKEIEKIFSLSAFMKMNLKHDRLYSAALNHFKKYITFCNELEFEKEMLNDKLEYKNGLVKYIKTMNENETIEDQAKQVPQSIIINGRELWKRNPIYAAKTISIANYQCEVDPDHKQFISKITKNNYVEAHHLIPIRFSK